MTELPPYDSTFDLGGLPGLDAPLDTTAGDALFADPLAISLPGAVAPPPAPTVRLGQAQAPQPSAPAISAAPAAAPTPAAPMPHPSTPAPRQMPAPPTVPPQRPRPSATPRRGSGASPVRRFIPILVIGWLILSFGRGLWASTQDAGTSESGPVVEQVEPVPVEDPGWATGYSGPEAVPADEIILGTGLPNSADAVTITISGTVATMSHYVAYGDGEVIDEVDKRGDYSLLADFANYQTIVVETDGGGGGCAVFVDETLVAASTQLLEGRCVFDKQSLADALPGE